MQKFPVPITTFSLLVLGIFFRFSYLTWGYPYFFHPDENNIISAIGRLSFSQWNPHFFAYGGLPIYATFLVSSLIALGNRDFATITYSLRFISALLSFLLIPSVFFIGKKMFSQQVGIIAALFSIFSVGFIQFAHFGTFEMWLTFFTLWLLYASFLLYKFPNKHHVLFTGIIAGILLSIKISSLVFIPIPLGILFLLAIRKPHRKFLFFGLIYALLVICVYVLTNPYLLLDTQSFISSLLFESSVATGTLPVFYTQTFIHTTPIIFQIFHVFPFLINPVLLLLLAIALSVSSVRIRRWNISQTLLILFFACAFFSEAFLFVKWTRYMIPTLPFIYLLVANFISSFPKKISLWVISILVVVSAAYAFSFFFLVYPHDSRLVAAKQIQSLSQERTVIEPYDLGALAFNIYLPHIEIVDIYNIETNRAEQLKFVEGLNNASLFISPSQRIFPTRLADAKDFPRGNLLYTHLFRGDIGYHLIYQTPCNIMCYFVYSGNPIYSVEQTATVFDHPFVSIFQR